MAGILEQAFLMGLGTLAVTKNTAEKLVNDALNQEKITPEEGNAFLKTVEEEGTKTKKALDDAVSNALKRHLNIEYSNLTYTEHALTTGSSSAAVTYVSITFPDGKVSWGVGVHDDIIAASINALVSAINRKMISEN